MKKILMILSIAMFIIPTTTYAGKPVVLEKHGYVVKEPHINHQYYIKQSFIDGAWNNTQGTSDIAIALIDSSADQKHKDLKNVAKVINSMKGPYSVDYHGTHTAGIMAGKHNSFGIAGIAPNVRYHFYNVFYGKNSEYTDSWTVAKAVDKAVQNGASIINISLGGDYYDRRLANSIRQAHSKGVIVVASSGNDGKNKISFPASMKEVIAVGAIDSRHRIADFSNMNADVKIVAPGVNILSLGINNRFVYMDGTSMAAPMVSSSLALVKSINPFLTPMEINTLISKMPREKGKSYTALNTKKLIEATPLPLKISSSSKWQKRYIDDVNLSVINHKNLKVTYELYSGRKKVKTLTPNKSFTMYYGGDWLPSGKYKLVAKVTDGKFSRKDSKVIEYVNTVKTSVSVLNTEGNTLTLRTSRKGVVTVLDADGNKMYKALHIAGTFPVRGDTTKPLTVILKPTDVREKVVSTTYTPPFVEEEPPVVESL